MLTILADALMNAARQQNGLPLRDYRTERYLPQEGRRAERRIEHPFDANRDLW